MAYMSQEHKKEIAAALKKVMPPGWKYSLAVDNYSTIVLRIAAAPVDLISENLSPASHKDHRYIQLNPYYLEKEYSGETLKVFEAIKAVLYKGNHNHSDIMSDYHDVGWYVDIHVGRWDKPFMYVPSGDRRIKAA